MPNREEEPVRPWKYGNADNTAILGTQNSELRTQNQIRLGLRLVAGLSEEDIKAIEAAREERPFESLLDFCIRVPLHRDTLENLILAGAFDSLHEHRRGLLWRLDETLSLANTYRGWDKPTFVNRKSSIVDLEAVPQLYHIL